MLVGVCVSAGVEVTAVVNAVESAAHHRLPRHNPCFTVSQTVDEMNTNKSSRIQR